MTANLEKLLRDCTVFITDGQGKAAGSGFFIAPGLLLTAAHVVHKAGPQARLRWRNVEIARPTVDRQDPREHDGTGPCQLPDLALLRVNDPKHRGTSMCDAGRRTARS